MEEDDGNKDILASLWDVIRRDLGVTKSQVNMFVELHLARRQMRGSEEKGYAKGNLVRALSDSKMTFRVFMNALEVIGVVDGYLVVVLRFPNGYVTQHRQPIVVRKTMDIGTVPHINPANRKVILKWPPNLTTNDSAPEEEYVLVDFGEF